MLWCFLPETSAQVSCFQGDQTPAHRDPHEQRADSTDFAGQTSVDPNEIIGPQGYDTLQWVSIHDLLNYTIYFENDPEFATANAQRVDVRFDFSNKNLMKDFMLGTYGFANMSWNIEQEANTYQNRLDLVDSMQIYVDLIAGLDVMQKQAFWKFSSIDPATGFAPWQHDRGMLPVNDSTHAGEGFVQFSLKPISTMKTGDTISIAARIVFDDNDTIPTNRWKNVIDAGNPTSKVLLAEEQSKDTVCYLTFQAHDDENGSGIRQIRLYLANQFGVFEELAVCQADSIFKLKTEPGRQYELYTLAEDNVGNLEAIKEQPDLIINHNVAPTDILLSDSTFQNDLEPGGFIGELSTIDTDPDAKFTYALAEGDGAIHNELFTVDGTQLKALANFKCSEDSVYSIRLSTTDPGGLSYSKAFTLRMKMVLERPQADTLNVTICEGDVYNFFGQEIDQAGQYFYSKENDGTCDSLFVLNLQVSAIPQAPVVTIQNGTTLVSSIDKGNLWFKDGELIKGATEKTFTPQESGTYYAVQTNGHCDSDPSDKFYANLSNNSELKLELSKDWTWVSSNLKDIRDPKVLLSPVSEEMERFVGFTQELVSDPSYGLTGNLKEILASEGYKIKMKQEASLNLSGKVYLPDEVTLSMQSGWNWIGYLPTSASNLEDALVNLTPSENDIIKGQTEFATFTNGQWIGTLNTLYPGKGYLYHAAKAQSFQYPHTRITRITESAKTPMLTRTSDDIWNVDEHKYPNNMTLIGQVIANDVPAPTGAFTIGAFCKDECRGIGEYVNDRLFLVIAGNSESEKITFKAIENVTGKEYAIKENLTFGENGVGTYNAPFKLRVSNTNDLNGASKDEDYNIYPVPARDVLFINGNLEQIKNIKIISVSGAVMDVQNIYNPESGIDVSHLSEGNYILGIVVGNKVIYKRFIKVH